MPNRLDETAEAQTTSAWTQLAAAFGCCVETPLEPATILAAVGRSLGRSFGRGLGRSFGRGLGRSLRSPKGPADGRVRSDPCRSHLQDRGSR